MGRITLRYLPVLDEIILKFMFWIEIIFYLKNLQKCINLFGIEMVLNLYVFDRYGS